MLEFKVRNTGPALPDIKDLSPVAEVYPFVYLISVTRHNSRIFHLHEGSLQYGGGKPSEDCWEISAPIQGTFHLYDSRQQYMMIKRTVHKHKITTYM